MKVNKKILGIISGVILIGATTLFGYGYVESKKDFERYEEMTTVIDYYNEHKVDILYEATLDPLLNNLFVNAYEQNTTKTYLDRELLDECESEINTMNENMNKIDMDFMKYMYETYSDVTKEEYLEYSKEYYGQLKPFVDSINFIYEDALKDGSVDYWDLKIINEGLTQMNIHK